MFVQPLLCALKGIPHAKYEEKKLIMPFSLLFHNIGPNLVQILPRDHTHFFAIFQWNMLGDSININNFNCNPVVLKKKNGKTSKTLSFLHPKQKVFLQKQSQIISFQKHFILSKYVLGELWIFLYFVRCIFAKKGHFQPYQLWGIFVSAKPNQTSYTIDW